MHRAVFDDFFGFLLRLHDIACEGVYRRGDSVDFFGRAFFIRLNVAVRVGVHNYIAYAKCHARVAVVQDVLAVDKLRK